MALVELIAFECPHPRRGQLRKPTRNIYNTIYLGVDAVILRNQSSGERTRTPINGTKTRCPAIERPRNGFALTSLR